LKNNLQFVQSTDQTTAKFLLLINRSTYRARFVTSQAIHVADAGEWDIEIKGEAKTGESKTVVISFPRGYILDSQNRAWMKGMSSIQPASIIMPYEYPVSLSSLGVRPRYYVQFPRACSLTLESSLPIGGQQGT
jgi:hypothetical protein